MSLSQTVVQWIAEEAFPIVFIFCSIVVAYMVYAAAFRKRILPTLLNRRVEELLHTPSGTRRAVAASGTGPAAIASGIRPPAPNQTPAEPREASHPRPIDKPL